MMKSDKMQSHMKEMMDNMNGMMNNYDEMMKQLQQENLK
jgi:hypothetical protein